MARINIEDHLFKDPRWLRLLIKTGDEYRSLGLLASAWILAQEHWLKHGNIPEKAWRKDLDILIEVEFANRHKDGSVYVKGSKKAFGWLDQRSAAGKKGGSSRSEKKIEASKSNRLKKEAESVISNIQAEESNRSISGRLTEPSGTNPPSLTLPLTLSPTLNSSSDSNSSSNTKYNIPQKIFEGDGFTKFKLTNEELEEIYREYPRKLGKSKGFAKLKTNLKCKSDVELFKKAIARYKEYLSKNQTGPGYIRHFDTFVNSWKDWLDDDVGHAEKIKKELDTSYLGEL